jgi:hypothetical protein
MNNWFMPSFSIALQLHALNTLSLTLFYFFCRVAKNYNRCETSEVSIFSQFIAEVNFFVKKTVHIAGFRDIPFLSVHLGLLDNSNKHKRKQFLDVAVLI